MELKKNAAEKKVDTQEKKRFSKLACMLESIKRPLAIAAVSMTFLVSCGPDSKPDGGQQDGSVTSDGGGGHKDGGDGGSGGADSGTPASLCAQYGEGNPNRATFNLGDVKKPAQNTGDYLTYFSDIVIDTSNGDIFAEFPFYPADFSSGPVWKSFKENETRAVDIPTIGSVKFELCNVTSNPCKITAPGGTITGDASCKATLASEKPWGQ